ncbi:NDR1/HIN1-like protein 6, partial [Tanacetum coccineum]
MVVDSDDVIRQLQEFIMSDMFNGSDLKLVIQKRVYGTKNWLNMPFKLLETHDFLTPEKKQVLGDGFEIKVALVGPNLQIYNKPMSLIIGGMSKNKNYVLKTNWSDFVEVNKGCFERRHDYSRCGNDEALMRFWLNWKKIRLAPTTLREAFSIARIMEAHFESIAGKKLNIEEKIDIVLSWPSEEAPPVIEGSLDANEDIGVVEVSSAIDDVFDIGESNVERMEVRSEFSEFSENKESVEEVVVGGGQACGVGEDELNRVIPALKDGGGEIDGRLDE